MAAVDRLVELLEGLSPELGRRALTHSSWTENRAKSYERLAFLGDGVLGMVVADVLLRGDPEATAGDLTKIRAQAASRAACARVGDAIGIAERMTLLAPETAELPIEDVIGAQSVIAEVCEAVIGAAFEQYGYEQTADAVTLAFADEIEDAKRYPGDHKSSLQELLARRGQKPSYQLIGEEGPPHERRFECVVLIRGDRYGTGIGRSKKEAEQAAAKATLEQLQASTADGATD